MENLTPEIPLPGGGDIAPADGNGTDPVVELKDALNQVLKKPPEKAFKTNEDALKAVKETFDYVSKAGWHKKAVDAVAKAKGLDEKGAVKFIMENLTETKQEAPVAPAPAEKATTETVDPNKFISREEYDREMFFGKNQDYTPYKDIITGLQKSTGKPLDEVVQLPAVKTLFEKAKAYDETEKAKSVLMSNPRLGAVQDKITQARDAQNAGNHSQAKEMAVSAVMDLL